MSFITLDKLLQSWAYYLQQCSWIVRAQIQSNISSIIVISFRLENVKDGPSFITLSTLFLASTDSRGKSHVQTVEAIVMVITLNIVI